MHNFYMRSWIAAGILFASTSAALADPCEAPLPRAGTVFEGSARYIVDGDGFCISQSADPKTWIEIRLADFYAPELREQGGQRAKSALERIVLGKQIRCQARNRSYDRIVAECTVGGRSVAEMMRQSGISEGGRAFGNR